jgi:signal transduction histidine kinase
MHTPEYIYKRIECKQSDYAQYSFSQKEHIALATFFDLAQELDSLEDLYSLCVAIPKVFFNIDARLYLVEPKLNALALVSKTEGVEPELYTLLPEDIHPHTSPYYTQRNTLILTIRGKKFLIDQLPFKVNDDVIGLLEVYPVEGISNHEELFFEKYANRIGYNVHNRFLVEKNIEHLKFIKNLVSDIEHNIIVPNIIYKLFLRNMKDKISNSMELEKLLAGYKAEGEVDSAFIERLYTELMEVNAGLYEEFETIEKHYNNMRLFLETLLRRSHFDQGRLVLRTKSCNMKKDVVQSQLERFAERFKQLGIVIDDKFSVIPEEEIISVVDVGLMAQVYANLFSNALKYTEEIKTETGESKKYISYGREVIHNYFRQGKDGIKYNVFSTGPHIKPEEREKLFEEGYKGSNAVHKAGTGHGLAFIKNVVELHGGVVGYEPTNYGNNFYFVLPRENTENTQS